MREISESARSFVTARWKRTTVAKIDDLVDLGSRKFPLELSLSRYFKLKFLGIFSNFRPTLPLERKGQPGSEREVRGRKRLYATERKQKCAGGNRQTRNVNPFCC